MKNIFSKVFVTLAIAGIVISCNKDEAISNEQNNNEAPTQRVYDPDKVDYITVMNGSIFSVNGPEVVRVNQKINIELKYTEGTCTKFNKFVEYASANNTMIVGLETITPQKPCNKMLAEYTVNYEFIPSKVGVHTFKFRTAEGYKSITVNVIEDYNYDYKMTNIHSVNAPDQNVLNMVSVGDKINFELTYSTYNGCESFYRFVETVKGKNKIIEIQKVAPSDPNIVCTQEVTTRTVNYTFSPKEPGDYQLKFKTDEGYKVYDLRVFPLMVIQ